MSDIVRQLRQVRVVRWLGIPTYRLLARALPASGRPPLVVNSVPKAGTHLVMSLLKAVPGYWFSGHHVDVDMLRRPRSLRNTSLAGAADGAQFDQVFEQFSGLKAGRYATAHLPYSAEVVMALRVLNASMVLVIRDPRDVVVSYVKYVRRRPRHFHYRLFTEVLIDENDAYRAVIRGFRSNAASRGMLSIVDYFASYRPWLNLVDPRITIVRFEDLVGPLGGGSQCSQVEAVRRILSVAGYPNDAPSSEIEALAQAAWSPKSATFSTGKIGRWKSEMNEGTIELYRSVVTDQLTAFEVDVA